MPPLKATEAEWDLRWPHAPAVRARNGIAYLTVRRFSAQNRLGSIQAIKRLKAARSDRDIGIAAAEMAAQWLLLTGNPGGWTVTNIAAGHSGGNSFAARLAAAVAERLAIGYLQVWHDRPLKGVSHPKEFRRLPPLEMVARPLGAVLVIDDVATSGFHMEEALKSLRGLGLPCAGMAWVSADSATIGRPDWRSLNGRRNADALSEPAALPEREVGQSWRTQQGGIRDQAGG